MVAAVTEELTELQDKTTMAKLSKEIISIRSGLNCLQINLN
jgi:hypothetical protein